MSSVCRPVASLARAGRRPTRPSSSTVFSRTGRDGRMVEPAKLRSGSDWTTPATSPIQSVTCAPILSCARSQGSRPKIPGKRSGGGRRSSAFANSGTFPARTASWRFSEASAASRAAIDRSRRRRSMEYAGCRERHAGLSLAAPLLPALRISAAPLTRTYSCVRAKPLAADPAGALLHPPS